MDELIKRLQQHPKVILGMFLVTMLSSLMGIFLGWDKFYSDFLSKTLTLPVWIIIAALGIAALVRLYWPNRRAAPSELLLVEGQKFGVQQIVLDGKRFLNCTFDGTELVFRGEAAFGLERNHFRTPPRFVFEGSAGICFLTMRALYQSDEFRSYLERSLSSTEDGANSGN